jgi:hypothetical protein
MINHKIELIFIIPFFSADEDFTVFVAVLAAADF